MSVSSLDFESSASASSATSAKMKISGGPEGDRTHDLHNAIVALSQLSYRPIFYYNIDRVMGTVPISNYFDENRVRPANL